ncbi:MAG: rbsC 1 [Rariglobus sp.]|jgi:ribose/xylose/arabinose/galactoside ABC-type transport system permease subunit|nr:rbsC 1 [Rariglobus sp.]
MSSPSSVAAPSTAVHASPKPAPRRRRSFGQEVGLCLVVLVLGAILGIYGWHDAPAGRPNTFLSLDNLVDGIATPMSYYAIMAVGLTLVIITGGIDISVGSIMALSALGGAAALQTLPADASAWLVLPVAILTPLVIGLVCGLLNGSLIIGLSLHPFIVTLGTMSIFRGLANVLPPEKTLPAAGKRLPAAFTTDFMRLEWFGQQLMPLVIMLVCVAFGWFYLRLMVAGRETYAIGGNEEAARFSGLRVNRIKLRTYALSGLAAGLAGMVSLGRFGTASTSTGTGYELTVIAAAVVGGASLIGGRGTAIGALLGTLIIALIENGIIILRMAQEYRLIIIGLAIVVAVSLDRLSLYLRARRASR